MVLAQEASRCQNDKPLRVLIVCETFLPLIGGAEVHVLKLAQALQAQGLDVRVATAAKGPEEVEGVVARRLAGFNVYGKRGPFAVARELLPLMTLVRKADVVHAHYSARMAAIVGAFGRLFRRRIVVTLHGYGTHYSSVRDSRSARFWRWLSLKTAHEIIAVSEELALVARRVAPNKPVTVIASGVDTAQFAPRERPPRDTVIVGTVRRLVPKNGLHYLLQCLPYLDRTAPIRVRLIGDGRDRAKLERLVADLHLEDIVEFAGVIQNAELPAALDDLDIVAFPSTAEGTSVAALEAMAAGKAVVASSVSSYPGLLGSDERGIVVRLFDDTQSNYEPPDTLPDDALKRLAQAISRLAKDPDLRKQYGARARQYVCDEYDWSAIARRVAEKYR